MRSLAIDNQSGIFGSAESVGARLAAARRTAAKAAVIVARVLLGLSFTIFGANGFLQFIPHPPLSGTAGAFSGAMFASHYLLLVSGTELACGLLFLANRFVPLALVVLAAVLANILTFHLTMLRDGMPMALVVTALWAIVALPLRSQFSPLFVAKIHSGPLTGDVPQSNGNKVVT